MKKTLVLAASAAFIMACNSHSDHSNQQSTVDDHGEHAANKIDTNAITETMTQMMHDMHAVKSTGNNDIDFASMMLEHHKGAVEMSEIEQEKGVDSDLRNFAKKVIDDQTVEINFMKKFITESPKEPSGNSAEFQKALRHSMMAMMGDSIPVYNNIDKDFAAQMIPHHQSAVDMAQAYLQFGKESSLRKLCENIIASQTKEINWLKEWLSKK